MNRFHRIAAAVVLAASSLALADEGLASEGKTIDGFNFRLPVYNSQAVGTTVVGLDRFVGPDATDKNTRILLVSFMASFCGPCKKEMPYLEALYEKYKDQGLRIAMVSIDTEADGQKKIDDLIALNHVTFPVLKDRFNLAARRWLGSKTPLPSVFLIRPDGLIQTVHRGYNEDASKLFADAIGQAIGTKVEVTVAAPAVAEAAHDPAPVQPAVEAPKADPKAGKANAAKTAKAGKKGAKGKLDKATATQTAP